MNIKIIFFLISLTPTILHAYSEDRFEFSADNNEIKFIARDKIVTFVKLDNKSRKDHIGPEIQGISTREKKYCSAIYKSKEWINSIHLNTSLVKYFKKDNEILRSGSAEQLIHKNVTPTIIEATKRSTSWVIYKTTDGNTKDICLTGEKEVELKNNKNTNGNKGFFQN